MEPECGRRCLVEHGGQTGNVVIVAVAQNDGIGRTEINTELPRIGFEGESLACIEENAMIRSLNPVGEPVLTDEAGIADCVFADNGNFWHDSGRLDPGGIGMETMRVMGW